MRKFPEKLRKDFEAFRSLKTPAKIQDFLGTIPINFERSGDTCRSPLLVLEHNEAHCMEGALLAAAILWYHGEKPLLLDLKTTAKDESHVVALFRKHSHWGAISKTNHAVLRYREPIFKTVRELALSYFSEYFLDSGEKTLRSYSEPFNLLEYEDDWLTLNENLWRIVEDIDASPHAKILTSDMLRNLRKADSIEREAGKLTEWKSR
jgi:hypothetical protein